MGRERLSSGTAIIFVSRAMPDVHASKGKVGKFSGQRRAKPGRALWLDKIVDDGMEMVT